MIISIPQSILLICCRCGFEAAALACIQSNGFLQELTEESMISVYYTIQELAMKAVDDVGTCLVFGYTASRSLTREKSSCFYLQSFSSKLTYL